MMDAFEQLAKIVELNDDFRRAGPTTDWVVTAGVANRGGLFTALAFRSVMLFDGFGLDNDPYGEHAFAAFDIDGEKLSWKIDYYDKTCQWGSPDPKDPTLTRRVMTIMLASEY